MSTERVLIWDFDGTLGHRPGMLSQVLADVVQAACPGLGCTRDHVRPFLRDRFPWHRPQHPHTHITTAEMWWEEIAPLLERACVGVGCSPAQAKELAYQARWRYLDPQGWFLYEDVLPALKQLQDEGWIHVILSNHVPELPDLVAALGLSPCITRIFTSALLGYEKPHPQAFRYVLDELGNPPVVWMIGDNPEADIAGAEASGIPAILVRGTDRSARRSCPDFAALAPLLTDYPLRGRP
jgi:putative hydrolase of the HAD superfamily